MSKVYVLYTQDLADHSSNIDKIVGVISDYDTAEKFTVCGTKLYKERFRNKYYQVEFNDPELLNRIAKENNHENVT